MNQRDLAMLSLYLDEFDHGADHLFESDMGLHLLLEGTAQVKGGRSLGPGDVFGLTPFLDGGKALVAVESTSKCTVALLSRGCYAILKERRPSLAVDLLQGLLTEVARRNREA
jgi:CRP-like cAMP-binding protein